MPMIVCPACDSSIDVDKDTLILNNRFLCEQCEVLLEVTNEDPLEIEWGVEDADEDEDDEDDD